MSDLEQELENLNSLIETSKNPSGRARLAASGTVSATLGRLSVSSPLLLPSLRLLRNLCAGEISNQDSFIHSSGPEIIASLLISSPQPLSPEIIRAGIQVLGNVVLAGEEHRAAVWARFFPDGLVQLAQVRERGVCDPLCMLIDTCCSSIGGKRRLDELCGTETGVRVLVEIVTTASQVGYQEEWLEWLLFKACVEEEKFSLLFSSLISSNKNNPDLSSISKLKPENLNSKHSFLLGLISKCLTERPKEVTISDKFALDILNLVKINCTIVESTSRVNSTIPTGFPAIDSLGYCLLLLRDICAWEDENNKHNLVNLLLDNNLLNLMLSLLDELEPPSIIKKSMEKQASSSKTEETKKVCVYKGYRKDIVSIIANCLHNRKRVQDEIREKKMIPLILQQCVLDEENPFLREWGLFAVRNLVENNEENAKEISELELQEAVTTPEIAELGFKVEVDKELKRAKLVNVSG